MSVEEKQARSVFVGNIPHGTTEEQMKDIFSTVGTVLSFRIVYDRETGNPKGYGFAEYSDIEMAQSAIRNLNGYEFNGRTLRVDKASSQADELRMIHQQTGGPPVENPYGDNVSPDKAPEAISRAVASLPPEQMFELMKQMKLCIQNNMNEARTMLLNNPQLAYALLQAQVVMKIVDPNVAMALLHRKPDQIPPVMPSSGGPVSAQPTPAGSTTNAQNTTRPMQQQQQQQSHPPPSHPPPSHPHSHPLMTQGAGGPPLASSQVQPPRMPPTIPPPSQQQQPIHGPPGGGMDPRYQPGQAPPPNLPPTKPSPISPIQKSAGGPPANSSSAAAAAAAGAAAQAAGAASTGTTPASGSSVDQEKAALIMQVLQLTEDQIAMLPPEQRQSILLLKEQIAQSAGGL